MSIKEYFQQGLRIITLDAKTIGDISKDKSATIAALATCAILGIIVPLFSLNLGGMILLPATYIILLLAYAGVLVLIAKIFKGSGGYAETFRPLGMSLMLGWATAIPFISWIVMIPVGVWTIVMHVAIVKRVHNLSTGKATAVVLIPTFLMIVVVCVLLVVMAATIISLITQSGIGASELETVIQNLSAQ